MKKILVLVLLLILVVMPVCGLTALAEDTTYYVVGTSEVKFYYVPSVYVGLQEGFSLPKGYSFVCLEHNVFEKDGVKYAKVVYAGINGLILESQLETCTTSASPEHISPELVVQLNAPATVYTSPTDATPKNIDVAVRFLGEYKVSGVTKCYAVTKASGDDQNIYYVYAWGVANLTDVTNLLNPPEIKPNPEPAEVEPTTPSTDVGSEKVENRTVLRIILVLGIVVPAFIIILIVFKPGRKKQKIEREVEEDTDRYDDY